MTPRSARAAPSFRVDRHKELPSRALLRDPDLVVFDEPTSALDAASRDYLRETFRGLVADGKVVVIMTHDPALINDADVTYEIREQAVVPIRRNVTSTIAAAP